MTKKHWQILLSVILSVVMLFSVAYLVLEADHDCCGDGCVICELIRACLELVHLLVLPAGFLAAVLLRPTFVVGVPVLFPLFPQTTLVSLGVKLSD